MNSERSSQLGRAALMAWIVMQAIAISVFGFRFLRGTLGDPDVTSLFEAMMLPAVFMTLPFAVLAFGMLWPSMRGIEALTRGRLPRLANVLIGGVLTAPIFVVMLAGGRLLWPQHTTFVEHITRIVMSPRDLWVLASLVVGGMIVGAGAAVRDPFPAKH